MTIHKNKRFYEAILFDLDGVLADTQHWVISAYQYTAEMHKLTLAVADLAALFGQPLHACYQNLWDNADVDLLVGTHRSYQKQNMHLVTIFDGVHTLLATLRSAGLPLAIVTGRTQASAQDTLDRLRLTDYFDAVITADNTDRHKPHPEPVLCALAKIKMQPELALMVGDAQSDILAGQRAGCDTAGALYGFSGVELQSFQPTYVLNQPLDLLTVLKDPWISKSVLKSSNFSL